MRSSSTVMSTNISSVPAAEDAPNMDREREQLLDHTEEIGGSTRRAMTENVEDQHSNRCQVCGRDDIASNSEQKNYGNIDTFSPWFPETDPEHPRAQTWIKKLSQRGTALFIQIFISTTVLMFNISVTIYAMTKYGISKSLGDIYQGNCELVAKYNTFVHLGINILSTLLLGSSNYAAQLLAAPTRSEVDAAHEKGDWLDIGVPSLRNLWKKRIARKRRVAWTLLIISSILLHLVWNSAVFAARPFSLYQIAVVTSDYLNDAGPWPTQNNQTLRMLHNTQSLSRLDKPQCIERYTSSIPGQKDVLVIAANITMQDQALLAISNNSSSLLWETANVSNGAFWIWGQSWLCSAFARPGALPVSWCTADFLLPKQEDWTLSDYTYFSNGIVNKHLLVKVDHCLSAGVESLENFCALRYSAWILLMVCILNLGKCTIIYYTAYLHYRSDRKSREKAPLVTVGDATASFLAEPDITTKHLPFASREEFTGKKWPAKRSPWTHPGSSLYAISWFRAASLKRWLITLALCIAVLLAVTILLMKSIDHLRYRGISVDLGSLRAQGLGTPKPYATTLVNLAGTVNQLSGFFIATLFANMWQVFYSALYLLYNGLLTTMLVADEWNGFVKERKTLRLSSPRGIQRSSYFLSLPYRFSLPLMFASVVMHWLISQSVFVIQSIGVVYGTSFYRSPIYDSSLVGWSSIGMIYSLIVGFAMVVALVTLGSRNKYRPLERDKRLGTAAQSYTMPLVSSCSAAISAACHRPDEDLQSHLLPVRWGYVKPDYWCFTTSREVSYPALGPGTELEPFTLTNSRGKCHPHPPDVGRALQMPNLSQALLNHDGDTIREPQEEFDDASALLPRS